LTVTNAGKEDVNGEYRLVVHGDGQPEFRQKKLCWKKFAVADSMNFVRKFKKSKQVAKTAVVSKKKNMSKVAANLDIPERKEVTNLEYSIEFVVDDSVVGSMFGFANSSGWRIRYLDEDDLMMISSGPTLRFMEKEPFSDLYVCYQSSENATFPSADQAWRTMSPSMFNSSSANTVGLDPPPTVIPSGEMLRFVPVRQKLARRRSGSFGFSKTVPASKVAQTEDDEEEVENPRNALFGMLVPDDGTLFSLKRAIQKSKKIATYLQQVSHGGKVLEDALTIDWSQHSRLSSALELKEITESEVPKNTEPKQVQLVGAGPVGLWVSVQLKILCPNWKVVVHERRAEHQRKHTLRIDDRAFEELVQNEELTRLRAKWQPRVRTAIIEEDLSKLATQLGIEVRYESEVKSPDQFEEDAKGCDLVVIGCDGVRSVCRPSISADPEFREIRELGALLQVKFESNGEVHRAKGSLEKFLQNISAEEAFFNVLPGNFDPETKTTPVTAFALINKEIFDRLSQVPSFSGLTLEQLEAEFKDERMMTWTHDIIAVMKTACPDMIENSIKASVLPVRYQVASVVADYNELSIPVFVSGDAAMGLPLEKGLNYGWKIASRMCKYLAYCSTFDDAMEAYEAYFSEISDSALDHVHRDYRNYVNLVRNAEFARAFLNIFSMKGGDGASSKLASV
jgi:2-polyprenyl-6-methoxyphenol hydroxylase-like FAD-dependent oxidoreductase